MQKYWPIEEVDEKQKPEISKRKVDALFKKAKAYIADQNRLALNN